MGHRLVAAENIKGPLHIHHDCVWVCIPKLFQLSNRLPTVVYVIECYLLNGRDSFSKLLQLLHAARMH